MISIYIRILADLFVLSRYSGNSILRHLRISFATELENMAGFGLQALKRHPSLVPLVVIVGAGMVMSGVYLLRLAVKSPEVMWNKKNNPEPWNDYDKKQYKFYAAGRDYSAVEERPKF